MATMEKAFAGYQARQAVLVASKSSLARGVTWIQSKPNSKGDMPRSPHVAFYVNIFIMCKNCCLETQYLKDTESIS